MERWARCAWALRRVLLPGLLLAAVSHPVPARHHEYCRDGRGHLAGLCRKRAAAGDRIAKVAGIALLLYGLTVLVFPQVLPTFMAAGGMR